MSEGLVAAWTHILKGGEIPWALFQFGTVVMLPTPQDDLEVQACEILKFWGPVKAGTPSSSFSISPLKRPNKGCLVTCHHPDIITFVSQEEISNLGLADGLRLHVGGLGKQKRDQDAQLLKVIYTHDPRKHTEQNWGWATKQA